MFLLVLFINLNLYMAYAYIVKVFALIVLIRSQVTLLNLLLSLKNTLNYHSELG